MNPDQDKNSGAHGAKGEQGELEKGWFDVPENVNKIIWTLIALCVASVAAELFFHKHSPYDFLDFPGSDALYGFVSCVLLVLAAKRIRKVLMRDEDYYDG